MNLFEQLLIGGFMIGISVFLNALALDRIMCQIEPLEKHARKVIKKYWRPCLIAFLVLEIFLVHIVVMWLWAFLYLGLGCTALDGLSDALYFAVVVYTTLGFGDIILEPECRMLGGVEAANGFILFGWTTAFIFEIMTGFYRKESRRF